MMNLLAFATDFPSWGVPVIIVAVLLLILFVLQFQ